jgi:hypothetical protein
MIPSFYSSIIPAIRGTLAPTFFNSLGRDVKREKKLIGTFWEGPYRVEEGLPQTGGLVDFSRYFQDPGRKRGVWSVILLSLSSSIAVEFRKSYPSPEVEP